MNILKRKDSNGASMADTLKDWLMVLLTLTFVVLYGLALLGRLKPLADVSMVSRLEPIIFVIIGYYFGRLPGEQNEQTLKAELSRQTQKADAAQHAKETALQTREALDEKVKNARTALAVAAPGAVRAASGMAGNSSPGEPLYRDSVAAAFNILSS